jgi:predicted DNA-binding transcriptional regulator YafY
VADVHGRLFDLYDVLRRHGAAQTAEAARLIGQDVRTTRDDLKRLEDLGRITRRGEGRSSTWVCADGTGLRGPGVYDALFLRVGRELLGFLEPIGMSTLQRIDAQGALKPQQRSRLDRKLYVVHEPARRQDPELASHIFDEVVHGLLNEREVVLHRGSRGDERVGPLTLVVHRRGLYLLGRRAHDGTQRLYALDRLEGATCSDVPFAYPTDHHPRHMFRHTFGVHMSEPEAVTLRFPADRAAVARAREWHPGQTEQILADGGVEISFFAGGPELVSFVLSWGPACTVVRGDRLRSAVVEQHLAALAAYQGTEAGEGRLT